MKRHLIPNTELSVSSLCYGVMRFGAEVHGHDMHELYHVFCESGGNFFDTAHCYSCWYPNGDGCSERSKEVSRKRMQQSPGDGHRQLRFVLHVCAWPQEVKCPIVAAETREQHYIGSVRNVALIPAPGIAIRSRDRLTLPMD